VLKLAAPAARAAVPNVAAPSMKVTAPVGLAPATVAVKVTLCPAATVLALLLKLLVVGPAAHAAAVGASSAKLHTHAAHGLPIRLACSAFIELLP
jgi:hypothetical protein